MLASKTGEHPILEFWREAKTVKTSKGAEVLASCLDCKVEVDGFLALCEEDRNSIAADIQKLACEGILPKNFTPSCEDFLSMYLPTVLYMTFRQFSGEGYCTKHNHCDSASIAALNSISVYEQKTLAMQNCANIQSFIAQRVGTDARLRVNAIATVQDTVCTALPRVLHNMCYGFTEAIVPKGLNFFARFAAEGKLCADRK